MTADEAIDKYRASWLGFLAEGWTLRGLPPSDFSRVVERQETRMKQIITAMANDLAGNLRSSDGNSSSNGTVPSQQAGRPGVQGNAAHRPNPGRTQ